MKHYDALNVRVRSRVEAHRLLARAVRRLQRESGDLRATKGAALLAALRAYVGGGR